MDIHFYRVKDNSYFYNSVLRHHSLCGEFIRHAEKLVAAYKADSAVAQNRLDGITIIAGLNFTEENAPLFGWDIAPCYGYFYPTKRELQNDLTKVVLPSFDRFFLETTSLKMPQSLTYYVHNKDILVAVRSPRSLNEQERLEKILPILTRIDPISSHEYDLVCDKLTKKPWKPWFQHNTYIFTPSLEVIRINSERVNFHKNIGHAIKHSFPLRLAKHYAKCARNLGTSSP